MLEDANFQRWGADSTGHVERLCVHEPGPAYLERTSDVRVGCGRVSAPYDFWVEQTCSHCGYDAITLAQLDFRGWRIASLTYTVDASGEEACRERFAAE